MGNLEVMGAKPPFQRQATEKGKKGADFTFLVGATLTVVPAIAAVFLSFGFETALIAIVLGGFLGAFAIKKMVVPIVGKENYQIIPVGQHSYTISGIPQKIHDFFNLFLTTIDGNEPIYTFGSLEYDIKNEKILRYYGKNATFDIENNETLLGSMKEVAPLFFHYFSQTVLKKRIGKGDNCAIIHFTIVPFRTNLTIVHQDGVSSRDLRQMINNQGDERNSRWEKGKDRALLMDDALLFVYKKPSNPQLPIIPTLCVEFPKGSTLSDETKAFRENFETNGDYPLKLIENNTDLFKLPEIDENMAWVFRNNKTIHATPHKNVVEHFYGERVAERLLDPASFELSEDYISTPFLRVSVSTYRKTK